MNNPKKKKSGLEDLSRKNIKKEPPAMTQEEAAKTVADFYSTMANGIINLVAIHAAIQKDLSEIAIDTNDIAFYLKKLAIKNEAVDAMEIEEREREEEEPPPENSEVS